MDSLSGNEIYTTSAGLESNLIELAGGINTTKGMSDSRWFTTSVETLVTANPDVIIFNDYGVEGQFRRTWTSSPAMLLWQTYLLLKTRTMWLFRWHMLCTT